MVFSNPNQRILQRNLLYFFIVFLLVKPMYQQRKTPPSKHTYLNEQMSFGTFDNLRPNGILRHASYKFIQLKITTYYLFHKILKTPHVILQRSLLFFIPLFKISTFCTPETSKKLKPGKVTSYPNNNFK